MATIYRGADYRLEKAENIVTPKISVSRAKRTVIDAATGLLVRVEIIYNFSCKNFRNKPIDGIHHFCPSCEHRLICEINSKKFRDFFYKHHICPKCLKHNLSRYYVYLVWKLKDFMDVEKRECCWCRDEKE